MSQITHNDRNLKRKCRFWWCSTSMATSLCCLPLSPIVPSNHAMQVAKHAGGLVDAIAKTVFSKESFIKYDASEHFMAGRRAVLLARWIVRSVCAVRNCWEQWTREGTHVRKTGSGATRKSTRREDRRIVRQALVVSTVTRSTIRADVGVAILPQTISKHLAEANLKSKRPFRAFPLTPEHRQLRLQWCQARSMWNVTDWQKVLFSDEFRFVWGTDDNRVRVWRRHGERYNFPYTVLRHTARTAGVMVWGP
ncbi:HTH_Tnp_Tc3_2 domain-containing protein [Trichonephila clavipes]|uniref:HTH_Tnp_Tc3_2 domain-containing protein n=1 Tax=Trichonephila clavipes TaxID=2585209 RepID=A0A8X6V5H7_TRICX|nr:HTH_Tnp_Tc3_2 domain-containing protein [Trichonephila clavipes]